jgi:hypothetical protein
MEGRASEFLNRASVSSKTMRCSLYRQLSKLLCLYVFVSIVVQAQTAPAGAPIMVRGRVVDSGDAPVMGVQVIVGAASGKGGAHGLSSAQGDFSVGPLTAGTYELKVPATKGFAEQKQKVIVGPGMESVRVTLVPATVIETVNVGSGQPLSTESSANQDSISLSGDSLAHLPVFDQDFVSTLTPFLDAGATSTSGVSIVVDGVEMKGAPVSPSAIAEARLNSDPYSAEFSSPGRGRIEITTKPGSPEFHGTLNFIFRDATFNGKNYFAPVKAPEQRRIYEGHLTGPLGGARHTTFLISGSRQEDDLESAVHAIEPQGLVSLNAATPSRNTQLTGRVTHDFSDRHRLSLGYNFEYGTRTNAGVGGIVLPEAGRNMDSREDDLIINDRVLVSPHLIQQLQIVLEKDEDITRSVTAARSIQVQDSFTGGGAQMDQARTENTIHITDVVSWIRGKSYMRFGASIPQMSRRAVDDQSNRLGTFNFSSIADYENASPYEFTVQRGPGRGLYWMNELGAFVQDELTLRKNLQLTLGVRYQWQTYLSDRGNFAPRFSVAYSPSKRMVIRGGAGMFYDRTGGDFPATFKLHNGIVLQQFQLINPSYPEPLNPGQSLGAIPTSIVREDARLRAPYQLQYSVTLERRLAAGLTATAGYRGITGVASFRSRDANAPLPPDYQVRPEPALGFVQQIESAGRTRLNALDLGLHGRAGQWFEGQAQYTFSHNNADTGGINWFPQDQYNPNAEWGRTDYDRRHRFNLLGTLHPDHWLSLGVAATLYSGAPYTELAGTDFYNTGLGNTRPAGVGRNTLQGTGTADLDLLWDHDFPLNRAKAEHAKLLNVGVSAFNVLNHTNLLNYVGNLRSPFYRQATTAAAARQLQFGIRYQF